MYVGGTSYVNGAQILTTATVNTFITSGVSSIIAGTGTYINTSTGAVTIWINTGTTVSGASTATNIAGGAANQIVYQASTGTTGFITAPASTSTVTTILSYSTGTGFTWTNIASLSIGLGMTVDPFSGTGGTSSFYLSTTPTNANYIQVNVDGVTQLKTSYTLTNNLLTFYGTPSLGSNIQVTTFASNGPVVNNNGSTSSVTITGASGLVQYNNSGALGGASGISYNNVSNQVTFPTLTSSVSTTTGAVIISGGVAIGDNLYVQGKIVGGGVRSTSSTTSPSNPTVGDWWYNTTTDTLYRYTYDGVSYLWLDMGGSSITALLNGNFNGITSSGDILPSVDNTYNLGSSSTQWKSLYVSTSTIYIGGTAVSVANGTLQVGGAPVSGSGSASTASNFTVTNNLSVGGVILGSVINFTQITTATDCGSLSVTVDAFGVTTTDYTQVTDSMFTGPITVLDLSTAGTNTASPI